MLKKIFFILLPFILSSEDFLRKIENHFLLEDYEGALKEIKKIEAVYPKEKEVQKAHIRALIATGKEEDALTLLDNLLLCVDLKKDPAILEDLAWGILKKGLKSSQYATRLSSLIGIYFTHDAKAVSVIKEMMRDSNTILRSVALQLATHYKDGPLIEEIVSLFENEKVYFVRLEVLKAMASLKIKSKEADLKEILKNDRATYEERSLAIEALVNIYDKINLSDLKILLTSPYAGFRILAAELGAHFNIKEVKEDIANLVTDKRYDVRLAALNAIALFYKDVFSKEELEKLLLTQEADINAYVAITASFISLLIDENSTQIKKWLNDSYGENRRFAASLLAHSGSHGKSLSFYALENNQDEFVRANVALGLIGQREHLKKCSDFIVNFIKNKKGMWMWEDTGLFQVLAPSKIKHIEQIPNYPEAMDQVVQLNLLSLLAMIEDSRAQDVIKSFLKAKSWGITGLASITLLQEGDEESLTLLKKLLQDDDKNIKVQAALAVAIIGKDKSALPILESAYFEASHDLKLNILQAIGSIGKMDSFPFLLKVLKEPFQILRIAAASAIIQAANS